MSKVDIRRLDSVTANDTTATALINENFEKLQAGIEDALSRTGKTPNFMDADFDMNSRRIINCGEAVEDNDVVTYKVVKDSISTAKDSATSAANSAAQAATSAQSALVSSTNAINALRNAEDTLTLASGLLTETQQYVEFAKADIDVVVQDAKDAVDDTIAGAVEDVKQEAMNAANSVIEQAAELAANSAKATVDEYVLGTVTPQVQGFVNIAQQAASNADADATNAEESATIASNEADEAKHWADDAKIWATGTDGEVETIAPGEEKHSSREYAARAENSANTASTAAISAEAAATTAWGKINNIGDIFFTTRTEAEVNGAVECNGSTYNVGDYTGEHSVQNMLESGKLPYVSFSEYESTLSTSGAVRCFGYEPGSATFRVPTLSGVLIKAGTAESSGEAVRYYEARTGTILYYVKYRAMVQLANAAKEISVVDYTSQIDAFTQTCKETVEKAGAGITTYQQEIIDLGNISGTVNLTINKVYSGQVQGTTTFVLPIVEDRSRLSQIMLQINPTASHTINWGTPYFFNQQVPSITGGLYNVYYEFDKLLGDWVCGVMVKGTE